jgi:alpha-beta hydrolase superfamily lysophospholipase
MLVLEPPKARRGIVLFGPGAGGQPGRYEELLDGFVDAGFVVLAPTHERFDPRTVTTQQLQERVVGLKKMLSDYGDSHLPVIAAGHSVGGWAALCLAGARPWTQDGQEIAVTTEERASRLVLYAPTVGWFRAPEALAKVRQPIIVHAGANDTITPPATAELLRAAPAPVSIRIHKNVGHYDFMTELPPAVAPTTGLDRQAFLGELIESVVADEV